ncbi:MAG: MFS transporter [Dehalococcoidia bacterium]|nr:MFS transporter [Dehalococcoidia bacterium]
MTWEGTASMGFWSITTSGFLAAYALMLGCSALQIGFLASLPYLTQPLQLLSIPLVERLRRRKAIALMAWFPAQLLWIPIALIPIFVEVPSSGAVAILLSVIAIRGIFASVTSCAWNSWVKDLIPQNVLGAFFARRQTWANIVGMTFGLVAAIFIDVWKGHASGHTEALGYTFVLLFGIVFLGLTSPIFMTRIPEPMMPPQTGRQPHLRSTLSVPFEDSNFRHLIFFLFSWGLALNLATPFFAVYMLTDLKLSLSLVMGLSILSQLSNIMFLRVWGSLADRFSFKAVLSVSASLYLLVIISWVLAGFSDRYLLLLPLLVLLHLLAGAASAGVTVGTGSIGLKLAPQGFATSYLAVAALATGLGAGLGPLIGGTLAGSLGYDILFGVAFVFGLLTLHALRSLREEGEVGREVLIETLFAPGRQFSRPMSSVAGLNFLGQFPYGYLRRIPIPGLDVAMGVMSYQVAETAKATVVAAGHIESGTRKVTRSLERNLANLLEVSEEALPVHQFEVAREGVRGAIHALSETALDIGRLTNSAVLGVVRALEHPLSDPKDALRGAGYGAVQGAGEIGSDLAETARQAVAAGKELAEPRGLSQEAAASQVAKGAMEAAEALGPEAAESVKESLSRDISIENLPEM